METTPDRRVFRELKNDGQKTSCIVVNAYDWSSCARVRVRGSVGCTSLKSWFPANARLRDHAKVELPEIQRSRSFIIHARQPTSRLPEERMFTGQQVFHVIIIVF